MKKRVFSFVALLLCTVLLLGSCGEDAVESPTFDSIFTGSNYEGAGAFAQKEQITALDDAEVEEVFGDLVYFYRENGTIVTHTLYNLETGKALLSLVDTEKITNEISFVALAYLYDVTSDALFLVKSVDTSAGVETTKLYDASGSMIASAKGDVDVEEQIADLLLFDGVYYRVDLDGKLTKLFEKAPLANALPDFKIWNDSYYYVGSSGGVQLYSRETLKPVKIIPFSGRYTDESNWFVLKNGNILFQGSYRVPDDAKEFDLLKDEKKFALDTFIFDVKTGEATEVEFDYYIESAVTQSLPSLEIMVKLGYMPTMAEIDNIFCVHPIVEQHVEDTGYAEKWYLVNNDCEITGTLSEYLSQGSSGLPTPAANGHFFLSDIMGNEYLLNAKGEVVGEGYSYRALHNDRYFVTDGKILDYSLSVLYDYKAGGYELVSVLADSVLLSKSVKNAEGEYVTEYSLYKEGNLTVMIAGDRNASEVSLYYSFMIFRQIENGELLYVVYDADGKQLFTSEHYITVCTDRNSAALLSTYEWTDTFDMKTVYYRIFE